ncbi:hypothetical protein [Glycomyces sp. YM15]|uniref:ATP-dependent DNA ligase n=1 Tax=Glycomyces sp. YM15 TaxID=2800446 RepID=UPI00196655F9|nr:hypothetical protein [Glycomyces sp. YM15]
MEGKLPIGPGWSYEAKWDGIRVIVGTDDRQFRLVTRGGRDIADRFPELAAITAVSSVVLDGELMVFTGDKPDFGAVLSRMGGAKRNARAAAERSPATVIVFDLLAQSGEDLRARPYQERRTALEALTLPDGWIVPPVSRDAAAMVAASATHGLEGVVAKRRDSKYISGRRSRAWVKMRHKTAIDALVIGWASRSKGGVSLLLGEETPDGLVYLGRCQTSADVSATLASLEVSEPAAAVPHARGGVHWVRPELAVEVTAPSRTPDGRLRHAKLLRVRLDSLE